MEDNPADVMLVQEMLNESGISCELTLIADGEKAMRFIEELDHQRRPCPDLVLLDLKLPKSEGHKVLERMRGSTQCPKVPVVILTSSDDAEDRAKAARLGATRYLRKPSRLDDFIGLGSVIRQVLNDRSQ